MVRYIDSKNLSGEWREEIVLDVPEDERKFCMIFRGRMPTHAHLSVHLRAPRSRAEVYFGVVGRGSDFSSITCEFFHEARETFGRVSAKAALFDDARLDLHGLLSVSSRAGASDTYFAGKALLMSERARARILPYLEIHTNEVKASHGSATGRVREEDLFYFATRGVLRERAERILLGAFFSDIARFLPREEQETFFQYGTGV